MLKMNYILKYIEIENIKTLQFLKLTTELFKKIFIEKSYCFFIIHHKTVFPFSTISLIIEKLRRNIFNSR